jgi:hypothetical protein
MKLHAITDQPPPDGRRRTLHNEEAFALGAVLPELSDLGLTVLAHLIMHEQQTRARQSAPHTPDALLVARKALEAIACEHVAYPETNYPDYASMAIVRSREALKALGWQDR